MDQRIENSLEKYIVGQANESAYSKAKAFVENPSETELLFVYGKTGCGKTYLLKAMEEALIESGISAKYTYGETMIGEMIFHIRKDGAQEEFYQEMGKNDVLLVDDIHYLAGKEYSQKYLAEVWVRLLQNGVRVVLTADKQLEEFPWMSSRLCEQLQDGNVKVKNMQEFKIQEVEIQDADAELKMNILRKLEAEWNETISEEERENIAREAENIRQLEGMFKREMAWRRLSKKD